MKLIIIGLLFLISPAQSKEIDIEGEMICKVKSNYVVEINEGKTKKYSGIEGSFDKGDNLVFKFFTDKQVKSAEIELLYKDNGLAKHYINNSKYSVKKIKLTDDGFSYGSGHRRIYQFSGDYISFTLYPTEGRDFRIRRYYKGDWNGVISGKLFSGGDGVGENVATLDCRQSSDKVDEFVEYARWLAENE